MAISVSDSPTYVPYKGVRDNAFFGTTEEMLQIMERMKSQMLSLISKRCNELIRINEYE